MKKFMKYLIILMLIVSLGGSIYMEFNRIKGEVDFYQPHENSKSLNQEISQKDMLYTIYYVTIPIMAFYILARGVRISAKKVTNSKTIISLGVIVLYIYALANLILGFDVVTKAQMLTARTNEYVMPWLDFMNPFIKVSIALAIIYLIEKYIDHTQKKNFVRSKKFGALSDIIKESN